MSMFTYKHCERCGETFAAVEDEKICPKCHEVTLGETPAPDTVHESR